MVQSRGRVYRLLCDEQTGWVECVSCYAVVNFTFLTRVVRVRRFCVVSSYYLSAIIEENQVNRTIQVIKTDRESIVLEVPQVLKGKRWSNAFVSS